MTLLSDTDEQWETSDRHTRGTHDHTFTQQPWKETSLPDKL
jgi:hypothetical protein